MSGAEQPEGTRPAAYRLDHLPALAVLDDACSVRAVVRLDPALGAVAAGRQQARAIARNLRLPLRQPAPVDLGERLQQQALCKEVQSSDEIDTSTAIQAEIADYVPAGADDITD